MVLKLPSPRSKRLSKRGFIYKGEEKGLGRLSKMGSEQMNSNGFRAKMEHYIYSGEKKHVMAGMAIIGVIFGVPWYLMNRGTY